MTDPRTYYTGWTTGGGHGGSTAANPIAPRTHDGVMSDYAKAVADTPGLTHWWRFDQALSSAGYTGNAPYWANSAGATTLRSMGAATSRVGGLIADENGHGCDLNGGYLDGVDYRAHLTTMEVMTAEMWVDVRSIKGDAALMGEWMSGSGWLLYTGPSGRDIRLYAGAAFLNAPNALTIGKHHIVGVWGGTEAPTPDYYTRLYLDGVEISSGLLVSGVPINNPNVRFQVGNYSNGQGTNSLDAVVDEVAIYSRMLQPAEVAQHFEAGT